MNATVELSVPRRTSPAVLAPVAAVGFWLFTYLLLSVRAEMLRGDGFDGLSLKRLVATLIGAVLLGLVLAATGQRNLSTSRRLAILGTIFPASAAVFAARVTLDYFYYGQPLTLEDDVRWVLVWAGYFGLWLSAALAFSLGRAAAAPPAGVPAVAPLREDRSPKRRDWLADVIADELADTPRHWPFDLGGRPTAGAGYDSADELDPDYHRHRARLALARRIAARLQREADRLDPLQR